MARIELPPGNLDEAYRLFTLAPKISRPAAAFSEAIYNESTMPMRLRELIRMRIANINQCHV
jgi:alkylhydroperoxidase family enzyme